jgi:hypothetical protein
MLDRRLLHAFMNTFFGYGNLGAEVWFVGMEEAGGKTEAEVKGRLEAWGSRGRREIEDAAGFHQAAGMGNLFYGKGRVQPTWKGLIRTIFAIQGRNVTNEQMRSFQNYDLGRIPGCAAFLELMPLPSPNSRVWYYGEGQGEPLRPWTNIPYLEARPGYEAIMRAYRCARLRQLIEFHSPKAVVFYGGNRDRLAQEFDANFDEPVIRSEHTQYMHLVHPMARGHEPAALAAIYSQAGTSLEGIGIRC